MGKVRPGVTVDEDIWRRCKALSDKFSVINWSEIVEASLVETLIILEEVIKEVPQDKKSSDEMVDRVLLYFQAKYHKSLGEVYSAKSKTKLSDIQEQPK